MNKQYTVVAAFQARAGKEAALSEALGKLLVPTRSEEGCLNYDLHESLEAPGKFLFYENWSSQAAHHNHMGSAHIKELEERLEELCANTPEITFWEELL